MKQVYFILLFISFSTLYAQKNIFDICRNGSIEEITILYNENPDIINKRNESGYSPLIIACYHGNETIVAFLVNLVNDINGSSDYGTPLMAAVVKGNINIVKLLLEKNADTNITDANGTNALHYATIFKLEDIAKLLVNAGAKIDIKDQHGKSPLDYAILNKNEEIIKILKSTKS